MHKTLSRSLLIFVILLLAAVYFSIQRYVGSEIPPICLIGDKLESATHSINAYLQTHTTQANALLIFYSAIGDLTVLFLLFVAIKKRTSHSLLALFLFLFSRQILQILVTLPLSADTIWRYPGFPSIFSTYDINNDFYFSAFTGISLLGALELARFQIKWLTVLGFIFPFLEALIDILLRSHYTTDIYTSIVTAICAYSLATRWAPTLDLILPKSHAREAIHSLFALGPGIRFRKKPTLYLLISLIILGIIAYLFSQHMIHQKTISTCGIIDALQNLTLPINRYLQAHPTLANAALILICNLLDVLTLFICIMTLVKRTILPFLSLNLFFMLRQTLQLLVALPIPPNNIWHYPGFPSLLQTYTISNDLYFSGHTGVSLLAALVICRYFHSWQLKALGFFFFALEVFAVITMQIHYTMDVYTAIVTVYCVHAWAEKWAPPLDKVLGAVPEGRGWRALKRIFRK